MLKHKPKTTNEAGQLAEHYYHSTSNTHTSFAIREHVRDPYKNNMSKT